MKSKILQSIATLVAFFCTVLNAECFANQIPPEVEFETPLERSEFSEEMKEFYKQAAQKPLAVQDARILSVIAYANTDFPGPWVDEKVILIPEGWDYFSHSFGKTSRFGFTAIHNPWFVCDPFNRSRITEVHVKVEAFDVQFGSAVGAELRVVIVPEGTFPYIQE